MTSIFRIISQQLYFQGKLFAKVWAKICHLEKCGFPCDQFMQVKTYRFKTAARNWDEQKETGRGSEARLDFRRSLGSGDFGEERRLISRNSGW